MSGKVRAAPSASLTSSPQADRLHVAERSDARRTPSTDRRRGSEISARRERDKDDERSPKIERDADRSREAKGTGGRAASGTVREAVVERKYRLADAELVGPDELPVSMRRAGGAIVHSVLLDVQAPLYYQSAALLADLGYEAGAREALRSSGESSSSASASAPSLTWQAAEATLVSAASLAAQCSPLPDDLRLRVRASALPPAPPMEGGGAEEREGGAGRSAPLSGWLRLYAASAGKWRRLFFVLHSNRLLYFKKAPAALDDAPAPEGVLLLDERAFAKEVKALSPTPLLDTALAANKETRKLDAFVELRLSTAPVLLSLAEIEPPVRRQWLQRLSAQPRVFGARLAAFAAPPPLFLEMVEYLAAGRCVATEGLFRMSGSAARIERYVEQYNKGEAVDLAAERDPHTVAGLLRLWVRELQEPLLTEALYAEWIALARLQDARLQLLAALALVQRLPAVHRDCLARLFELFAQIVASESVNKMGVGNLATVFGANLLRVPAARAGDVGEAKAVNGVFVTLFDFHPHLFHRLPLPRRRAALLTAVALDAPHAADARANGLVGLAAGTELDVLLLPSPDATHLVATTRDALRAGLVPAASVAFLPRAKLPSWAEAQLQRSAARHAALVRERELLTRAVRDPAAHSLYRSQLCARGDAWLARHPALRANVAALAAAAAALAKAQRQAESARRALEPVLEPAARAAAAAADVEREAAARAAAEALLQPAKEAAAPAARLPGLLGSLRGVLAGPVARATLHSRSFLSLAYAPPVPPVPPVPEP